MNFNYLTETVAQDIDKGKKGTYIEDLLQNSALFSSLAFKALTPFNSSFCKRTSDKKVLNPEVLLLLPSIVKETVSNITQARNLVGGTGE